LKSLAEPCSLAHTRIREFAFTSLKQVRELLELRRFAWENDIRIGVHKVFVRDSPSTIALQVA
jgi:hypothetical protein